MVKKKDNTVVGEDEEERSKRIWLTYRESKII